MKESSKEIPVWLKISWTVFAFPVFFFFPLGTTMLAMTGKQLIWGFDDMPLGAMFAGFSIGIVIAVAGFGFVVSGLLRGALRGPLAVTLAATVLDCAALPIARYVTDVVEQRSPSFF